MQLINKHNFNYFPDIFSVQELKKLFLFLQTNYDEKQKPIYGEWTRLRDYVIARVMYELALRPLECLRIKIQEIDFLNGKIIINRNNNKRDKGRTMLLDSDLANLLKRYLNNWQTKKYMQSDFIFPTCQSKIINSDTWKQHFQEVLKGAGIYRDPTRGTHGHLSSYSLRHSRATYLYMQTHDIFFVADYLGHTTLNSTHVYIHLARLAQGYFNYIRKSIQNLNKIQNLYAE